MSSTVVKSPRVDIRFQDLTYKVHSGRLGSKTVLHSNSGTFFGGNLTGILGTSGAGKSTLLNILAGYVKYGVSGEIFVNEEPVNTKMFSNISTYIMQEDALQSFITVKEYIMFAIDLKMSPDINKVQKEIIIKRVTDNLGLSNCLETRTEHLSGGQRKRLSIAIELVNNPSIIFLDEPTTGLDDVSVKQCAQLLKSLAKQGKTVICTIHQPSDSVFKLFDYVYFMDSGYCTYTGPIDKLVPFLSYSGFSCPTTYNPADYIIELTQLQPDSVKILSKQIKTIQYKRSQENVYKSSEVYTNVYAVVSIWKQIMILLRRNYLQMFRNKLTLFMQLLHHVLSGLVIGTTFVGIGKDASMVYENFKFGMTVIIYIVYSNAIVPPLTYPVEVKLVKREYFNGWYDLKAYFFTLIVTPLLTMIVFGNLFIIIVYAFTDQPVTIDRYFYFTLPVLLLGMNSNAYGLAVGTVLNPKNGAAFTPATLAPMVVLSFYGMGFGRDMEPIFSALQQLVFFRYGIVAVCNSMFGGRDDFVCPEHEVYCHYKDTDLFLKDMGMYGISYSFQILVLVGFVLLHFLAGYFFLKVRFSTNLTERVKHIKSSL